MSQYLGCVGLNFAWLDQGIANTTCFLDICSVNRKDVYIYLRQMR